MHAGKDLRYLCLLSSSSSLHIAADCWRLRGWDSARSYVCVYLARVLMETQKTVLGKKNEEKVLLIVSLTNGDVTALGLRVRLWTGTV